MSVPISAIETGAPGGQPFQPVVSSVSDGYGHGNTATGRVSELGTEMRGIFIKRRMKRRRSSSAWRERGRHVKNQGQVRSHRRRHGRGTAKMECRKEIVEAQRHESERAVVQRSKSEIQATGNRKDRSRSIHQAQIKVCRERKGWGLY